METIKVEVRPQYHQSCLPAEIFIEVGSENKVLSITEIGNGPKEILEMKVLERVPVRLVRDVDMFRGRNDCEMKFRLKRFINNVVHMS